MKRKQKLGPVSRWERRMEKKVAKAFPKKRSKPSFMDKLRRVQGDKQAIGLTAGVMGAALGLGMALSGSGSGGEVAAPTTGPNYTDPYFIRKEEHSMEQDNNEFEYVPVDVKPAIDKIAAGVDGEEAREVIHQALGDRVLEILDARKQEIARTFFNSGPAGQVEEDDSEQ